VKTSSGDVRMPLVRSGELTRATGEAPGTGYTYRIAQDLGDPESTVDLAVTSEASGKRWASSATAAENRDRSVDLWGLLIARLLPM
jgi:hypothetical protein